MTIGQDSHGGLSFSFVFCEYNKNMKNEWKPYHPRIRCSSQADRFFRPAFIRNHQVCPQRVQTPFLAFHGCVKGFQIDRQICTLFVFHTEIVLTHSFECELFLLISIILSLIAVKEGLEYDQRRSTATIGIRT